MTNAGCCARLAQKTKARRLVTEISFANNLQGHRTTQINIERLVGDAHSAATQLDRFPVFAGHESLVFKGGQSRPRGGLERTFQSRLAGVTLRVESLAQDAHRTEFHRSRKLSAAGQTGASVLHFHGLNRPSDATRAPQSAWIAPSISPGSDTVRPTSSRKRQVYCFRNR